MSKKLYPFLLLCFFSFSLQAQPPMVSYTNFITGLTVPVDLVNAGDGSNRLFIVQQNGVILVRSGTSPFGLTQFLDLGTTTGSGLNLISYSAGGERGLLSMAFHPDYDGTTNRFFFVYYTEVATGRIVVRRFQTTSGDPNTVNVGSSLLIMGIDHPGQSNHNGGKLNFGPDGYLYFATGDGGGANDVPNNAQNGNSLLGKMIRIGIDNPVAQTSGNYVIPADNPYVSDASIRDEIWALGLRNPFRWSFDRANGNMWIGDVGQGAKEEINFRAAGSTGGVNYGWRCYEGYIPTPGVASCTPANNTYPVYDYDNPASGSSAVTGGYVYRGTEYPNFRGYYMATDVYIGSLYFLWPNGTGGFDSSIQTMGSSAFVVGFGEAEDGTLYAVSQGSNSILKVVATGGTPLPVRLGNLAATRFDGYNEIMWTTLAEENTSRFYIEWSTDRRQFSRVGAVAATRNSSGANYSFRHTAVPGEKTLYYRLAIEDDNGAVKYSSIVMVPGNLQGALKIYPTIIQNGILNLLLSQPATSLQLVNTNGAVVFEKKLNGSTGSMAITLPALPKGMYVASVVTAGGVAKEKVIVE